MWPILFKIEKCLTNFIPVMTSGIKNTNIYQASIFIGARYPVLSNDIGNAVNNEYYVMTYVMPWLMSVIRVIN